MKAKLRDLKETEISDIIAYSKRHSLREVAAYIKEKYGISISHASVSKYLNVSWKALTNREYAISQEVLTGIEEVIANYRALLASLGNNKAAKIKVLKNFGNFLSDMYARMGTGQPNITETKEIETKHELDWQKEIK